MLSSSRTVANQKGLTLIELLVSLTILSILAGIALPYAEVAWRRDQEQELRRALREMRTAIDRFHDDAMAGKISKLTAVASEDRYPVTLEVLVRGVDRGDAAGKKIRYLRRIPGDPFADTQVPAAEHWRLRSYQDAIDSPDWGGQDVYDVRSTSDRQALDGSWIRNW